MKDLIKINETKNGRKLNKTELRIIEGIEKSREKKRDNKAMNRMHAEIYGKG